MFNKILRCRDAAKIIEQIVLQYDKRQDQPLVYVGMSRVTSLDGLYMTNVTNDFTFYHGSGSVAPEVTDEYLRLGRHELPTLEKKAIRCMPYRRDREDKQETTFTISHNVQSVWYNFIETLI